MTIQDPLKKYDEIFEPDPREANLGGGLKDIHNALTSIVLVESVPIDIRQLFETAKNICLYSYFVYRFNQVSELVAYSALEMGLRHRYEDEYPDKKSPMLSGLLKHAGDNGWIENDKFTYMDGAARRNAEIKKFIEVIKSGIFEEVDEVPVEEPTDKELERALEELDLVGGIVASVAKLRNELAHGSTMLHPNSISTLRMVCDVINQVFENRNKG